MLYDVHIQYTEIKVFPHIPNVQDHGSTCFEANSTRLIVTRSFP